MLNDHYVLKVSLRSFGAFSDFQQTCTCISKRANCGAKWTKIWTSGVGEGVCGYLVYLPVLLPLKCSRSVGGHSVDFQLLHSLNFNKVHTDLELLQHIHKVEV